MEINDLQKTSIDNQPLAQTVLEINDLCELPFLVHLAKTWTTRWILRAFFFRFGWIHLDSLGFGWIDLD
jgi:hypothetical protein